MEEKVTEEIKRAPAWAKDKMEKVGLEKVTIEPFMDYGDAVLISPPYTLDMAAMADQRVPRNPLK